jgi:hypothetical protein
VAACGQLERTLKLPEIFFDKLFFSEEFPRSRGGTELISKGDSANKGRAEVGWDEYEH